MNRTSFKSNHFPKNRNKLAITQEYAMQYYAIFTIVVMMGVMMTVANGNGGRSLLFWAIVGELVALLFANMMAFAKLKRHYAQIQFVNDHFSLISVYDIIYENEHHAFPLRYANPSRNGDNIQFHYNDQIIDLNQKDWGDDFDLIWNWLVAQPNESANLWNSSIS